MTFDRKPLGLTAFLIMFVTACLLFSADRMMDLKLAPSRMKNDFLLEVKRRGLEKQFSEYQQFISSRVSTTRFSDKCRLPWIEELLNKPLDASVSAEQFTAQLYSDSATDQPLLRLLERASLKLPLKQNTETGKAAGENDLLEDPFQFLTKKIHQTRLLMDRAYRSLSDSEKNELREKMFAQTTTEGTLGFRFGGEDHGARVIDLLLRIDLNEILNASRELAALTHPAFIRSLDSFYKNRSNRAVLRELHTPDGIILVGGDGPNIYHLDQSLHVYAVVDFGGDDIYDEGSVTGERPVMVIIDLNGNDTYRGRNRAIQGAAILGASLLFDRAGNDKYESYDLSQGSSLSGIGILMDESGDDSYTGNRRVQGQAVNGFGILIDRAGHDKYRAALFAQGVGGPLGIGILVDRMGDDLYFAGGKYEDSYDESPGFASWSQGIGVGARDVANGGIGVLLDGRGNDIYEADYFSHGGGYWFGAGFARDFEGDDQRLGAVRTNIDGTPRSVERYLRWGIGFGCHYAAGFVFDDRGNDTYEGDWASIAYAWDVAIGAIFDGDGSDRYHSRGSGVSEARNSGFAVLFDMRGTDQYSGAGLGNADTKRARAEHSMFSFAFLQDRGGQDTFSQPLKNHTKAQRGWAGGFFIDR